MFDFTTNGEPPSIGLKGGKIALTWTRLSCHAFRDNKVRLQLFALAYNLGNCLRQLGLPRKIKYWTLITLWKKLIKIDAKVVRHTRYITFQLAEVAVPRKLFESILERINRLRRLPETGQIQITAQIGITIKQGQRSI